MDSVQMHTESSNHAIAQRVQSVGGFYKLTPNDNCVSAVRYIRMKEPHLHQIMSCYLRLASGTFYEIYKVR